MNDGTYKEGESMDTITITVRFKTKHNPANEGHKRQLCLSYFPSKGVPIKLEGENLIMEI
jgi:hypothetical protein